jgi:histidyl-tRNA synthetase
MRILDCKSPVCSGIAKDAPLISDYLCDECSEHFSQLKNMLDSMNISYKVNPKIVRGLDYYTKTVFEFITTDIGAQGTVCAGGRYDGLVEQLGGAATPALGFAAGIERLIMTMEKQECAFIEPRKCDLYIVPMGSNALGRAVNLAGLLRNEGFMVEYDLMNRSLKAQMKYANKTGASYVLVLGDNELESGCAKLKNMKSGEETELKLDDNSVVEQFSTEYMSGCLDCLDTDGIF